MAENIRGRSRDGQNSSGRNRSSIEQAKSNFAADRQQSSNRRYSDADAGSSAGRKGSTRGSGSFNKRDIFSSDYDGQLSDE